MSERGEASRINAKLQKNSGRGKIQKGDATWRNYVLDFKEFTSSFAITKNVWAKIVTDCMKVDRYKSPAIALVLGEGSQKVRLAIIEWSEFERLVNADEPDNS